jgi:hypothetical protein
MKMKLFPFIAAIAVLALTSCAPQSENTNEQAEMPPAGQLTEGETGLEGNWINKKYADELAKTGSPRASQTAADLSMLVFPRELKNIAIIIWNFHEGTNSVVKQLDKNSFAFQPHAGDPNKTIMLENDIIKTGDDEFIRLSEIPAKRDYYVAEQLLFAGKYDLNGKPVEFTKDGRIIGIDGFTYYSVVLDYNDAAMDVDQVRLGTAIENSKSYGFTFSGKTLTIYELKCVQTEDGKCMSVANGKELYKLVKSTQ